MADQGRSWQPDDVVDLTVSQLIGSPPRQARQNPFGLDHGLLCFSLLFGSL